MSEVCLSFTAEVMIMAREERLLKLAVYQSVLLGKIMLHTLSCLFWWVMLLHRYICLLVCHCFASPHIVCILRVGLFLKCRNALIVLCCYVYVAISVMLSEHRLSVFGTDTVKSWWIVTVKKKSVRLHQQRQPLAARLLPTVNNVFQPLWYYDEAASSLFLSVFAVSPCLLCSLFPISQSGCVFFADLGYLVAAPAISANPVFTCAIPVFPATSSCLPLIL